MSDYGGQNSDSHCIKAKKKKPSEVNSSAASDRGGNDVPSNIASGPVLLGGVDDGAALLNGRRMPGAGIRERVVQTPTPLGSALGRDGMAGSGPTI